MNDVVLLSLIGNGFWLVSIGSTLLLFKKEIRSVLSKVGSVSIGGSQFTFENKNDEARAYADLSDVLLTILSARDSGEKLVTILNHDNALKLAKFAKKYIIEVKESDQNLELLRSIAVILLQKDFLDDALIITDQILKSSPQSTHYLNMKAVILLNRQKEGDLVESLKIQDQLTENHPTSASFTFNKGVVFVRLKRYEEGYEEIRRSIELGIVNEVPGYRNDPSIQILRTKLPGKPALA
jgi:tetratricopeptide (TPR) repeat protein